MNKQISNIVFTKNRPLQLEGYLRSLYKHFPAEIIQTYILHKPDLFGSEYEQVFSNYADCIVVKERDFHSDLLNILNQIDTEYILFGIDDVVYFDSVNFDIIEKTFERYSRGIFGFSLRFSKENVASGGDKIQQTDVANETVYTVDWTNGQTAITKYPFELCATIYRTELVKKIINSSQNNNPIIKKVFSPRSALVKVLSKVISVRKILKSFGYFFNPNTFESWNCRWCQNHRQQLPVYLYFQKTCACAIQVNMVNTSTNNPWDGGDEHTVEALNDKYKQGHRLDIDFIAANKPVGTYCGRECFKLRKIEE